MWLFVEIVCNDMKIYNKNLDSTRINMEYRRLGQSGLKVSQFSLGSWITFAKQVDMTSAKTMIQYAFESGINFFDNAEVYANGQSEEIMGEVFKKLEIPRHHYIVSTKFFWGIENRVNLKNTLNRKYLLNAIEGSLKRLKMDYVDLVYCHRPDPDTSIEEVVMAMHDMVNRGQALYWGTSEWDAASIKKAYDFAVANGFHRPIVEQPQYNLLVRDKVEKEFASLYDTMGLGLTIWSPLASGILTGKYKSEIPKGSRLAIPQMSWLQEQLHQPETQSTLKKLEAVSKETGVSMAHLALGWCILNPHVSTVILGASRLEQLQDNLAALAQLPKIQAVYKQL